MDSIEVNRAKLTITVSVRCVPMLNGMLAGVCIHGHSLERLGELKKKRAWSKQFSELLQLDQHRHTAHDNESNESTHSKFMSVMQQTQIHLPGI